MPTNTNSMGIDPVYNSINDTWSLSGINLFPVFKGGLIAILIIYAIVSLVVIKQIYLMTSTIKSKTNAIIILMGYANVFIVLIILLFALYL